MALKLDQILFTGPFELDHYVFYKNKNATIILIILKCGESYDPKFKLVDIIKTEKKDIYFNNYESKDLKSFLKKEDKKNLKIYIREYDSKSKEERDSFYIELKKKIKEKNKIYLNF